MSEKNMQTVQQMYAAFGKGDIPALLEANADEAVWSYNVSKSDAPWHVPAKGKAQIPRLLADLAGAIEIHAYEPKEFIHSGDHVVSHVHFSYTVKKTGKKVDEEMLLWWTFNAQGKVIRLVHFEDTAQTLEAWRGAPVGAKA